MTNRKIRGEEAELLKENYVLFLEVFSHLPFPPHSLQPRIRKLWLYWLTNAALSFSIHYILQVEEWTFHYMQGSSLILLTGHDFHKRVSKTHLEIWFIFILGTVRNKILLGVPQCLWEALNIAHMKTFEALLRGRRWIHTGESGFFVWKALCWW